MLVVIDYGMGNLRSVQNKFKKMGINTIISSNKNEILNADKLILPGVGHFRYGMQQLEKLGLIDLLTLKVLIKKTPILGICLGTQLFAKHSEEGDCIGLGWIEADVVRFKVSDTIKYKVPHMGWNDVCVVNSNKLSVDIDIEDQFYFVHSYHLRCSCDKDVWMTTKYEYEFVSAVHKNNIYGVQFHPEKSHDVGFNFLKKFVEL